MCKNLLKIRKEKIRKGEKVVPIPISSLQKSVVFAETDNNNRVQEEEDDPKKEKKKRLN